MGAGGVGVGVERVSAVDLGLVGLLSMVRVLVGMLVDMVRMGRVERIVMKALRRHGDDSSVLIARKAENGSCHRRCHANVFAR
jgi:hypothetical protein